MINLVFVLTIIACILLILIVLVQNSKGGGLASNFASSNQVMGVRKTTDFLEKATWFLAAALLVFSITSAALIDKGQDQKPTDVEQRILNTQDPNQTSEFGADDKAKQPAQKPAEKPAEKKADKK